MADYSSLTVPKLKDECGSRGLLKTGNKAELIARLEEADASGQDNVTEEVVKTAEQVEVVQQTREDEMKETPVEDSTSTSTAQPTNNLPSLHSDPTISATLSTLPPDLQEEYHRRLARATKFGTPLSEVKVPGVEVKKSTKPVASNGKKAAAVPAVAAAAPATITAAIAPSTSASKPVKEPKIPIQAAAPVDEETLKRRRERFGEVAKDEPKKKVKADIAVKNGAAEKKVEEPKVVDPEVAKRLQEEEERKRKRAERFGVAEPPASTTTAAPTTTTTKTSA